MAPFDRSCCWTVICWKCLAPLFRGWPLDFQQDLWYQKTGVPSLRCDRDWWYVQQFWYNTGVWWLNGRTDHKRASITLCINEVNWVVCVLLQVNGIALFSCLKAIRRLQRFGHLPSDATVFKSYAVDGNFSDVRLAALEALVDFTAGSLALFT